ncbi:MAG: hypothetical protein ACO3NR_07925, partial [Rhodothermales bacterium]
HPRIQTIQERVWRVQLCADGRTSSDSRILPFGWDGGGMAGVEEGWTMSRLGVDRGSARRVDWAWTGSS